MADNAASLVVRLEARFDKMQKQLRDAGLAADKSAQEIEDRFAKVNPKLGVATGTAIGNIASNVIVRSFSQLINFVEELATRFSDLDKTAKLAGVSMNELFGAQKALGGSSADVNSGFASIATLLDRAGRTEDNALSKLLAVNDQDVKNVKDAADAFDRVIDIIFRAKNEIQAKEIGASLGFSPDLVERIRKVGGTFEDAKKAAADAAPDLQRLANISQEFDRLWKEAVEKIKGYFVAGFAAVGAVLADFLVDVAKALEQLEQFISNVKQFLGSSADQSTIGDMAEALRESADRMRNRSLQSGRVLEGRSELARGEASKAAPIGAAASAATKDTLTSLEKMTIELEKQRDLEKVNFQTIGLGNVARAEARALVEAHAAAQKDVEKGLRETADLTELETARIKEAAAATSEWKDQAAVLNDKMAFTRDIAGDALKGFVHDLKEGKSEAEALGNLLDRISNKLVDKAIDIGISALLGGGPTGASGGLLTNALFGKRAMGGPVRAGQPYLVGERRPELFVPNVDGVIRPNVSQWGGGAVTVAPSYQINGTGLSADQLQAVMEANNRQLIRNLPALMRSTGRRY